MLRKLELDIQIAKQGSRQSTTSQKKKKVFFFFIIHHEGGKKKKEICLSVVTLTVCSVKSLLSRQASFVTTSKQCLRTLAKGKKKTRSDSFAGALLRK